MSAKRRLDFHRSCSVLLGSRPSGYFDCFSLCRCVACDRFDRFNRAERFNDRSDRFERSDRADRFNRFDRNDRREYGARRFDGRSEERRGFGDRGDRFDRNDRFDLGERRQGYGDRRNYGSRQNQGRGREEFGVRSGPRARAYDERRYVERSDFAKNALVRIDADIADFFGSPEAVNKALRLLVDAARVVNFSRTEKPVREDAIEPETAAQIFASEDLEDDEEADYGAEMADLNEAAFDAEVETAGEASANEEDEVAAEPAQVEVEAQSVADVAEKTIEAK